jgi:hypothetical protein
MYYSKKNYTLRGFRKSNRKNKKYYALLEDKQHHKLIKVHFGSTLYQHYKDATGLSDYVYLNHNNEERRRRYRARHNKDIRDDYYSPGYFAYFYLW